MSNNQFPFGYLHPVDIILTRTSGVLAMANLVGQAMATLKKPRFTHVAVCVAAGALLDAQPTYGVRLRNVIHEVIAGRLTSAMLAKGHLKVLRHKSIVEDPDTDDAYEKMFEAFKGAGPQLEKKYSNLFLVPKRSDFRSGSIIKRAVAEAAFCSELVVLVLRSLNMLPQRFSRPSAVLPVHFQQLEKYKDWVDVTPTIAGWLASTERFSQSSDMGDGRILGEEMAQYNLSIRSVPAFHQSIRSTTSPRTVAKKHK